MGWIKGDDSGSETLTEDDHLWETHTNELRVAVNASMREVFNVKGAYGAVGDGNVDDTVAIQNALDAGAGSIVYFPKGDYKISTTLTVSDNTTIIGYNARVFNTVTQQYLITGASGMKIFGLELEGVGNATANINARGISIVGADSSNYKSNIIIKDCYIHDIGFYGIYGEFVDNMLIQNTRLHSIGYSGSMNISAKNVHLSYCWIKDIEPGATNAYGVSFTRWNGSDLTINPFSEDCSASNCRIEDITLWKGLDTHAGVNIAFNYNTIKNCKTAISLTHSKGAGGVDFGAATDSVAIGNKIYGLGTGISVSGSIERQSRNNIISDNMLYHCGGTANTSGAMGCNYTDNIVIANNTIYQPRVHGIHIFHNNYGFSCTGNTIIDPHDSSYSGVAAIGFRSGDNKGIVSGNSLRRVNDSLDTYVAERGISCSLLTNSDITIGPNYNNCVLPLVGLSGSAVNYGIHSVAKSKFFAGSASPEGSITADIGSIYIRTGGGAGTTLYIKESGTDNLGWVGK